MTQVCGVTPYVYYLLRWARTETEDCLRRNISNTTDSVPSEIQRQ